MRNVCIAGLLLLVAACTRSPSDPGFESPNATVETLFRAYDVHEVPQAEVRRRLEARERFELIDPTLFRSCFTDWEGEHDQGLGGFVFGQLVAGKDELAVTLDDGTARVRVRSAPPDLAPVVLVKQGNAWKIDLRQSVPPEIRQQLYEVYRRARRVERRGE